MTSSPADSPQPITVYLVDDEAIVRAGLRALLTGGGPFEVVGESGDARAAIRELPDLRPDVVILDIAMDEMSGLDAVAPIKKAVPRTRVLMASTHEGHKFVFEALRAGADGYLSKSSDPRELVLAVEAIHRGESFVSPRVARGLVRQVRERADAQHEPEPAAPVSQIDELTAREREVFQLVAVGRANKEIARELGISVGTVKKHRENLQRKLGCGSAAEIARIAIREGLLAP